MLGVSALAAGFLGPISTLIGTALQFEQLGSYFERLDDVLSSEPEQTVTGQIPGAGLGGAIVLDHVDFAYTEGAPLVLRDVCVRIEPGQFVAIVGASGAGKSTLARLLVGLHRPTRGRVLFDGVDLDHLDLRSVRRQIGVVPQDPKLFARSIFANIALADPDASLERVAWAAWIAGIHDEIAAMPMGYESVLADGGSSLSGGQRQRIALARALLADPRILLLDEATSALDAVTERVVQNALAQLQCTRIAIAHRLSTVVRADAILVMDKGALVEWGTHEQLCSHGGVYANLVAAQLQGAGGPS
jgi:ABC-type bacteriocin/lantibiotic exporter with double-glycine peptidase domain